jgi:hypothetical protein
VTHDHPDPRQPERGQRQRHPRRAARPSDARRVTLTFALVALIGCTILVAAVTFVLSFHGLDDYGRRVARLTYLSPLVPIGVDGLTLVAVAATSILRHAPWHIRAYAWLVFAISVGLSVAGNLSHAVAEQLTWQGEIGAAASPLLLALASHLVIVTLRAIERQQEAQRASQARDSDIHDTATPAATVTHPPAQPVAATHDTPAPRPSHPVAPRPATLARQPRPGGTRATTNDVERARQMWRAGKSHPEIADATRCLEEDGRAVHRGAATRSGPCRRPRRRRTGR